MTAAAVAAWRFNCFSCGSAPRSAPIIVCRLSRIPEICWEGRHMNSIKMVSVLLVAGSSLAFVATPLNAQTYKTKHINRAIELLEQGQPVYYTGSHSGTDGSFEQGKKDAQTYADYISYDMEHAPFDIKGLSEYMRGLVAGGPTKSGHR